LLVVTSAIAFGIAGPCSKAALAAAGHDLTPLRLTEFRVTAAAVVLQLIVLIRRRPTAIRWNRALCAIVAAYGLIAFVTVQALYFVAISRMPVGVALLIEYLAPALVALWVVVVQHRRQPWTTWAGVVLTLVGLAFIARPWEHFTLDGVGVTAALIAAFALAAYFILAESAGGRIEPVPLCAWAATVGAVALAIGQPWWTFPWPVLSHRAQLHGRLVPVWTLLILVVLVGTVLAYLTGIAALTYLPAPAVAVLATLEVVVASATAWILLGEQLSGFDIGGGVVLLVGAALAQRRSPTASVQIPS
jgi:drug/metabolite transporter (DMT)-like permease